MKILNQNQGLGAIASPLLCIAKRKKGRKEKQEWVSEQKLLKVFHQGQNVTVLAIVRRLEFKNFSCRLITVVDNTFGVPWPLHFEIHFADPENWYQLFQ